MLNTVLEAVITYLSLIFGRALHLIAREEAKQGKKYIITARNALIILTSAAFIYSSFRLGSILFLLLGFVAFIFLKRFNLLIYFLMGFATFLILLTSNPIIPLLFIFLLAMMQSSLSHPNKREFFVASAYFILPFSLFLIETFIKGNLDIFTSFVAGGLLAQLKGP